MNYYFTTSPLSSFKLQIKALLLTAKPLLMKPHYSTYILLTILFVINILSAQNKKVVDSLVLLVSNKKTADTTQVLAYNDLGIQYATSSPKQAKIYINKALIIAKRIQKPRGIAGAYNCMGIVYYYQRELDSALVYFKKALTINKEISHQWGQASALHQIGAIYNLQGNYHEAIQSFQESGKIFKSKNDSLSFAKSIENIGVSYNQMRHRPKAIEYFLKAIQLHEKINDPTGVGRGYYHISHILISQHKYEEALEYLKEGLSKIEKDGNKQSIASISQNIGRCYKGLKQYDKALDYLQRVLDYKKSIGLKKTIASNQYIIGNTYYEKGEYYTAMRYYEKVLSNYPTTGNNKSKLSIYNAIANTYLKLKKTDLAKHYISKAITINKTNKDLKREKEINHILSLIAEQEGKSRQALQFYKNYERLKDSLYVLENQKRVGELQIIFETEKKERQITMKNTEIELLEQKAKMDNLQQLLLIIGLGLFMIIFGLSFYVFRLKIKRSILEKQKLNSELNYKKNELTTYALHIAKKNKVLENLRNEVNLIKHSEPQNAQYNYQKLIQTINFDLRDDENWENFRKYFEQVHKGFYCRIKKKYSHVTTNELRFLALLKMNLSSKEIGNILNISQEGVKKARYRLRKKLNLSPDCSLQDLILNL
ncbi:tetratricopeptide repeat protein [Aquimarina megaterium]|uniref:tetratricopeptide repeat protein n=1 Tax=Aquimarina megaterium TaxID=1443666 RepID=UPI000944A8F9|nr:tetratricopeptide repeat protein [Aquimarina megaterium]